MVVLLRELVVKRSEMKHGSSIHEGDANQTADRNVSFGSACFDTGDLITDTEWVVSE